MRTGVSLYFSRGTYEERIYIRWLEISYSRPPVSHLLLTFPCTSHQHSNAPHWLMLYYSYYNRKHFLLSWNLHLPFLNVLLYTGVEPVNGHPRQHSGKESTWKAADARDVVSISWSGRSPGEGNGNPLQYSCLEHSMGRGAWQATVCGVTESWTWLSTHRDRKWRKLLIYIEAILTN